MIEHTGYLIAGFAIGSVLSHYLSALIEPNKLAAATRRHIKTIFKGEA